MSERKPNPMVRFLESQGYEIEDKDPPDCEFCGGEWPWCDWDFASGEPPCRPNPPLEGGGK
jgi:hypothetical protein